MLYSLALVGLLAPYAWGDLVPKSKVYCSQDQDGSLYDYSATNLWGNETIEFSQYEGKVVLAYNVASG